MVGKTTESRSWTVTGISRGGTGRWIPTELYSDKCLQMQLRIDKKNNKFFICFFFYFYETPPKVYIKRCYM